MTAEALVAFEKLKRSLTSQPILVHPNFDKPFFVHCDASRYGIGACLMQKDDKDRDQAICYFSKKLNSAQRNYSVTELECLAAVLAVEKFRPYVELHQFTIITDHSALKWLMSQKDLNGRLARWSLRLQRFEFSIQHRKGQLNVVPDALSREADIAELCHNMPSIDLESPSFSSEEYSHLRSIVQENLDKLPDMKVSEGFVYKRVGLRTGSEVDELGLWRLWVPANLTYDLIKDSHACDDYLHSGINKNTQNLRQLYFWPRLNSQVAEYVRSCEKCKSVKKSNSTLHTKMGKNFETQRPFQHLFMDYLGPYPRSSQGNTHMLVILDHFTKYPIFVPLKHASAALTIDPLEKLVFSIFNVPETIMTDNGSQFVSRTFQEFLKSGNHPPKNPIYSPQANSSERLNQSIIQGIRMKMSTDHTKWDEYLTQIGFALRSTFHQSIGMSPHQALFGHEMVCHGSVYTLLKKLDCLQETDVRVDVDIDRIRRIQNGLMDKIRAAHEKNDRKYNLRVRKAKWVIGQEVFRRLFHQSDFGKQFIGKFAPKFAKCRVREILSENRLILEDLNGKIIGTYHSKDVKQ